jgi:hypothetical protein
MIRAALVAAAAVAVVAAPSAGASELIDRNATGVRLAVTKNGAALVSYTAGGKRRNVLAWGAIGARAPRQGRPQVAFRLDYSGPARVRNACRRYDGQALPWLVATCKAPDGSYWALQHWQRALPNYGLAPTPAQAAWELRLAHWRGPLAKLEAWTDWSYGGRYHSLFGRVSYAGAPVYGFKNSPAGAPLDAYGRNFYLDTYNSALGKGWRRENSFLARNPTGAFCYGLFPHGARPSGRGERYRITVIGPGVTPDVTWEGAGLPEYDPANSTHVTHEQEANRKLVEVIGQAGGCRT